MEKSTLTYYGRKVLSERAFLVMESLKGLMVSVKGPDSEYVRSPEDFYKTFKDMATLDREVFKTVFLNTRNRIIGSDITSIGTLTANLVHPREVFRRAVVYNAAALIVAHNHPSGDAEPSDEDIKVTTQLKDAGKILGIPLLDHIVIGANAYVSLKNRRLV